MEITPMQAAEIRKLTRRANRRLERASEGQRSALEHYVKQSAGAEKFSAATKGLSYEQAAAKLKALDKFLGGKSTTKRGWEEIKSENVRKANDTLSGMGYDLTDQELAELLEQIDTKDRKEFYKAVNLVAAAKEEAGEDWTGSSQQIAEAIAEKVSFQQAFQKALEARGK
jgi:hypothetical protein